MVMFPLDKEADLRRMIRLAPAHLRSADGAFIVNVYREGLGREPEFDPSGPDAPNLEGDAYTTRTDLIRNVVCSEESRQRGHAEALNAFASMLGYRQNRPVLVAALRALYPSQEDFADAVDGLIAEIRENSRRQDWIVAMCSAA